MDGPSSSPSSRTKLDDCAWKLVIFHFLIFIIKSYNCIFTTFSDSLALSSRYQSWRRFTMFQFYFLIVLLLPILPTCVSAQCAACSSYTNALSSCQSSAKDYETGSTMNTATIHCMCSTNSNQTDMTACELCVESNPSSTLVASVLSAWTTTCQADATFGDNQAVLCWESQPDNDIPCLTKSDGSGNGSSGAAGGDVASSTASAGTPSSTSSTNR